MTYALVHGDEPRVVLAADDDVMSRVLALRVVAATPATQFADADELEAIRGALLEERWADAVATWIESTGTVVDVFPDEPVWDTESADETWTSFEIRVSPIFRS